MKLKNEDPNKKIEPTKGELEILHVLWEHGPCSVRFVNDKMNEQREVNYTSTLKVMQIMADKGILRREENGVKHIYHPVEEEQKTQEHLLDRFVESVYQGATDKLVMQALGNKKASKKDLDTIREILAKLDKQ